MNRLEGNPRAYWNRRRVALIVGVVAAVAIPGLTWHGNDPQALRGEAGRAFERGDARAAAKALERLEGLGPLTAEDHLLAARVAEARGEDDRALAHLSEIHVPQAKFVRARAEAARLELGRDRLAVAERLLTEASTSDATNAALIRQLVSLHTRQGRSDVLVRDYGRLAKLETLGERELAAWTRARLGLPSTLDAAARVDDLADAVMADPSDLWSHLALSSAMLELGQTDQARRAIGDLVDVVPAIWAARARVELAAGQLNRANDLLARAAFDHPAVARTRAELEMARRNPASALEALRIAESAEPGRLDVCRLRLRALEELGQTDEARDAAAKLRRLEDLLSKVDVVLSGQSAGGAEQLATLGASCGSLSGDYVLAGAWYTLASERVDTRRPSPASGITTVARGRGPGHVEAEAIRLTSRR